MGRLCVARARRACPSTSASRRAETKERRICSVRAFARPVTGIAGQSGQTCGSNKHFERGRSEVLPTAISGYRQGLEARADLNTDNAGRVALQTADCRASSGGAVIMIPSRKRISGPLRWSRVRTQLTHQVSRAAKRMVEKKDIGSLVIAGCDAPEILEATEHDARADSRSGGAHERSPSYAGVGRHRPSGSSCIS